MVCSSRKQYYADKKLAHKRLIELVEKRKRNEKDV